MLKGSSVSTSRQAGERDHYPDGFDGKAILFNAHRVFQAEGLYVTDAPLHVLQAHQEGIVNAVSIFGSMMLIACMCFRILFDGERSHEWSFFDRGEAESALSLFWNSTNVLPEGMRGMVLLR